MCAIFGIVNNLHAAAVTHMALHSLQHRGQEGSGILSTDGHQAYLHKGHGLVNEVFSERVVEKLKGHAAVGHNRYSTAGGTAEENLHPFYTNSANGWFGVVHNGNLVNYPELVKELQGVFRGSADTECFLHLLVKEKFPENIFNSLKKVVGSYSLLILNGSSLYAIRDRHGIRPLVMGQLKDGWVVSSETTAFDLIGASFVREIKPGEVVEFPLDGGLPRSFKVFQPEKKFCSFEEIYFSRPDSYFGGKSVYEIRKLLGQMLAEEHPCSADMIVPVPDSGVPAAIGYSRVAGIPFEMGIVRSHYVGRSFILPDQQYRETAVRMKLNPVSSLIDKRVVVVDDSLVRGTTARQVVGILKKSGVSEIHLRISSPPVKHPCRYGIDFPDRNQLIASDQSVEEMVELLGVSSLGFLSVGGMKSVLGDGRCDACFTGNYFHGVKNG